VLSISPAHPLDPRSIQAPTPVLPYPILDEEEARGHSRMPSLLHEAAENIKDLFRHQTITIIDEHGNTVQKKAEIRPLQNPITLCMKLTWKNWLFFLVGKQFPCA
jgi:hypothetical protein